MCRIQSTLKTPTFTQLISTLNSSMKAYLRLSMSPMVSASALAGNGMAIGEMAEGVLVGRIPADSRLRSARLIQFYKASSDRRNLFLFCRFTSTDWTRAAIKAINLSKAAYPFEHRKLSDQMTLADHVNVKVILLSSNNDHSRSYFGLCSPLLGNGEWFLGLCSSHRLVWAGKKFRRCNHC